MASPQIIGSGTAIKLLSYQVEAAPDGSVIITVFDGQGSPECNGYGKTRLDAMGDLYQKGYQVVTDHFVKGDKIRWTTKRI